MDAGQPQIKRYRRTSLSSSSSLSGMDSDKDTKEKKPDIGVTKETLSRDSSRPSIFQIGKVPSKHASQNTPKVNIKDKLKKKMQAQLTKQFRADKKAMITKISQQEQERLDREEEIKTLALDMRRREREKRHRELEEEEREYRARRRERSSSSSDSSRNSSSPNRSPRQKPRSDRHIRSKNSDRHTDRRDEKVEDSRRYDDRRRGAQDGANARFEEGHGWNQRRSDGDAYGYNSERGPGGWDREARGPGGHRGSWGGGNERWERSARPDPRWDGAPLEGDFSRPPPPPPHWDNRHEDRHWGGRPDFSQRPPPPPPRGHRVHRQRSPLLSRNRYPNDHRLMDNYSDYH